MLRMGVNLSNPFHAFWTKPEIKNRVLLLEAEVYVNKKDKLWKFVFGLYVWLQQMR